MPAPAASPFLSRATRRSRGCRPRATSGPAGGRADRRSCAPASAAATRGPPSRRKSPHTTQVDDVPRLVRIVRRHHVFEGRVLEVFGRRRRNGRPHLIVILPDGSRLLIPTDWTEVVADAGLAGPVPGMAGQQRLLLLTVPDLLLTRALVDAVLRRSRAQEEEMDGAVGPELWRSQAAAGDGGLGDLDARQRQAVIALLARLIAKAAAAASGETDHDRIR